MYVAKNRLLLFLSLILLLLAETASARPINFESKYAGLSFNGGYTSNPNLSFLAPHSTADSTKTYVLGVAPFVRYQNMVFSPELSFYLPPTMHAGGIDTPTGNLYKERADSIIYTYGGNFTLIPHISKDMRFISFINFGAGLATFSSKNIRDYSSAAGAPLNSYTEHVKGSAPYYLFSTGSNFFFLQNYSLGLESGYRFLKMSGLTYKSDYDRTNTFRGAGSKLNNLDGTPATIGFSGFFFNVKLSLHF